MGQAIQALILIVIFLLVNFGLYKYRKSMKVEEGPFYSMFDSKGDLVVLPRYKGKTPAHLKKREIGFVESLFNTEDMFQKQAELKGFDTAEAYLAHLQGVSEEELIEEKMGVSKDVYYAQKQDMTLEEYQAVQSGTPVEEFRAKGYVNESAEKVKCPSCGAEVKKDSKFCSHCGEGMESEVIPAGQSFCSQCGVELKKNLKFCTKCGHKIS